MNSMVLTGRRQMEMRAAPTPALERATDVRVRMTAIGVCGSDVHYYASGQIGSQVVEYPFPVGHECAGVVESVGSGVTRVQPGDRVAIEPAMSCHACDQCLAGRPHTCRNLRFLGCPGQADGCLSEFIVMPEACCFPIPDAMSFEQAAISEPLSIGVYAVKRSVPMRDASIGILGAGPIGLSVLMPALAGGAKRVYVTDKIDERLALARTAGAAWTGNPASEDVVASILDAEPEKLDVVFECCGEQEAMDQAVDLIKPGGKVMMIGIPPTLSRWSFPVDTLRHQEVCLQNVRRQNGCVQEALDHIARGDFDVDAMVTHRFDFVDTQAAFDLVENYRDGVVKAMIHLA